MPKFTKCWYKDCDSDNRENPRLLFYKFPKDVDRCLQWINSCANEELTNIWKTTPDKVAAFRVCQKHFLKEFLGSSSRLVGHAVPAPYGVSLDRINAEKFMVECADLKSSSNSIRQHNQQQQRSQQQQQQLQSHNQESVPSRSVYYADISSNNHHHQDDMMSNMNHRNVDTYDKQVPPLVTQAMTNTELPPAGLLMTYDQNNYHHHQLVNNPNVSSKGHNSTTIYTSPCRINQYITPYSSSHHQEEQHNGSANNHHNISFGVGAEAATTTTMQLTQYQTVSAPPATTTSTLATNPSPGAGKLMNRNSNPKINYDREGKVISIQYPTETLSMMKTDDKEQYHAHIVALKHKVRHYQRKLAVINHRYQKLRGQIKGRSNKMRLLESLKVCKADFDPCIFDIFKRQIKGPTSKHGNRWSNDVKLFSSSIYLRSRSAYKFIRKTIDLPSESIVKRYIGEKKLSKLPNVGQDDDGEVEEDEEEVDGSDNNGVGQIEGDKDLEGTVTIVGEVQS